MNAGGEESFLEEANVDLAEALNDVYFGHCTQEFEDACVSVGLCQYGPPNEEDTDLGPYEAWRAENVGYAVTDAFIPSQKARLRDRAYVLWDNDRVGKIGRFKDEDKV